MKLIIFVAGLLVVLRITGCLTKSLKANPASPPVDLDTTDNTPGNELYPVQIGEKWGYMNRAGKLVIPAVYHEAYDFFEDRALVRYLESTPADGNIGSTNTLGYIDTRGKAITPFIYEQAKSFSDGMALIKRQRLFGYIDSSGVERIPPQFQDAASFSEGRAPVRRNGTTGLIDHSGTMVVELPFANTRVLSTIFFRQGYSPIYQNTPPEAKAGRDDLGGYINRDGNWLVRPAFVNVFAFSEGLAAVLEENYRYAFVDTTGRIVLRTEFQDTWGFHEGVAIGWKLTPDRKERIWYGIDRTGKVVLDNLNYRTVGSFQDGLAAVQDFRYGWGYIDKSGREIVKPQFSGINTFRNGLARVETGSFFKGVATGYIDTRGDFVWKARR